MATLTLRREDGRIVCERVVVADRAHRRMRGLLGRRHLRQGEGMVLRPGWSIHTAFMRFPIDVVFLDADQVVMKIEPNVGPWRTVSCRGAREVVELAAGECRRRGLEVGDRVAWASRSSGDARVSRHTRAHEGPGEPAELRGTVLVASSDQRFVRLARYLLGERELEARETTVDRLVEAIREPDLDVVVVDGAGDVAQALRVSNRARAARPEVPIVVAADTGGRSPGGLRVFDRWNETEELLADIERLLAERSAAASGLE
ncbi:MAG: hypothetical protein KatS3mg012_1776 [Gaiellaceae bacterium]|jgi:uncharacterized membrane protein (UPF0127 family)|nr:MAG: hypothetical protein KatS3mg012_1776 [Gaiellaceae bacterium]